MPALYPEKSMFIYGAGIPIIPMLCPAKHMPPRHAPVSHPRQARPSPHAPYKYVCTPGLWGVECILAVIGTGGP
eukprot:9078065-Pyramimonas_sp.AAC.1